MRPTLIACALFGLCLPLAHAQTPPVMPPVRIVLNDAQLQAIALQDVRMDTQIFANHARTVVTVVLKNPNNRQLEGNFEFPLLPEQHVSGFALDINGKLRNASSVPKARAQEVFEDIRRQQSDPGLLEKNAGNVYRLRVYPIPANGTRTVQITIDQLLTESNDALQLRLPMNFSSEIDQFTLNVRNAAGQTIKLTHGLNPIKATANGIAFTATHFKANDWLALEMPHSNNAQWSFETRNNKVYALAQLPIDTRKIAIDAPRVLPNTIDLFWDASTSANDGQTSRAIAALEAYLTLLLDNKVSPNITVHLVRNRIETLQSITLTRHNLVSLLELLQKTPYDGATRLDNLKPSPNSDLVILVSDGLASYGANKLNIEGNAPVYAFNTGIAHNALALSQLTDKRRGKLIDLTNGTSSEVIHQAVNALTQQHAFIKRIFSPNLNDAISPQYTLSNGYFNVAGQMLEAGSVAVELEDALGATHRLSFSMPSAPLNGTMAAQQWAQWQMDALSTDVAQHRKRMEKLSGDFGLVTDASSLLVLETAADYAR